MSACPKCGATPRTPLLCEGCDELLTPGTLASPFEALGLSPSYVVDRDALRKRMLQLSRRMHPDFHGGRSAEVRARAERNTAEVNAAHEILADDFRRADWLVESLGGPGEDQERQLPRAFLMEVLEWNETVEEARSVANPSERAASMDALRKKLLEERLSAMESVAALLEPLPEQGAPALRRVRRRLNVVRYLDRTLGEIAELALSRSSAPPH